MLEKKDTMHGRRVNSEWQNRMGYFIHHATRSLEDHDREEVIMRMAEMIEYRNDGNPATVFLRAIERVASAK